MTAPCELRVPGLFRVYGQLHIQAFIKSVVTCHGEATRRWKDGVSKAFEAVATAPSRGRFSQQFLDDRLNVLRSQADHTDDAFPVNDGVGRIVMHGPGFLGF